MKIGNRVAQFLCDRTVEKWLNFRLSNTLDLDIDVETPSFSDGQAENDEYYSPTRQAENDEYYSPTRQGKLLYNSTFAHRNMKTVLDITR
jgi:hypothetical protein